MQGFIWAISCFRVTLDTKNRLASTLSSLSSCCCRRSGGLSPLHHKVQTFKYPSLQLDSELCQDKLVADVGVTFVLGDTSTAFTGFCTGVIRNGCSSASPAFLLE